MKKLLYSGAIILSLAAIFSSCSKSNADTQAPATESATQAGLNIRYIDLDTISEHYQLVKDYNAKSLQTVSSIENAQRTEQAKLQKRASEIENKARSNGYISEATYQADVQKFQQEQRTAEQYIGNLQMQAQQEALDQSRALQDSINNFIADYIKTHPYDAILFRNAGAYFNPALDITKEVIEGLNARYKKEEKK